MPRDSGGTYSRIIPPGASGYQANTDILSAQVNGEINDIGNELTKSIAKDGTTSPTGNLPMANFVHTSMGQADAAGESLRYEALGKGSDIAVTANGAVTLPFEGSLFNLTAASAFNVTGFTGRHDGRPFCVRFNPDKLLTLVNSATFKLLGGTDRITRAGEIIHFTQESAGTIAEVGQQPIIDMTGYSGADIKLGISQSAVYDVTAVSSIALRIATGDKQGYELYILPDCPTGSGTGTIGVGATLAPNNASTMTWSRTYSYASENTPTALKESGSVAALGGGFTSIGFLARISTCTKSKQVQSNFYNLSNVANISGTVHSYAADVTTVWSSLGTININTMTGRVMVKRVM